MAEIDPNEKIQVGLYLPAALLEEIKFKALKEDRSVNNMMVKALKEAFMPELIPDSTSAES